MLIMSFIHSVIVSTNPGPEKRRERTRSKRKRRRRTYHSNPSRPEIKRESSEENLIKTKLIDPPKKKSSRNYIRRNKNSQLVETKKPYKKTLDEGFESFNGNGSSENGEESKANTFNNNNNNSLPVENSAEISLPQRAETQKSTSDEGESDTDTEPETVLRRRAPPKIYILKEESDTDSDTQVTFKSVASLVSNYIYLKHLTFTILI